MRGNHNHGVQKIRKIAILLVFIILSCPLFADGDFGSFGITGGYSSVSEYGYIGFNGTYQLLASVTDDVSIGMGLHSDFAFGLGNRRSLPLLLGVMGGAGFEFRFGNELSLNLSIGPAVVCDVSDRNTSVGIGLGIDGSFSYFFGQEKCVGFSIGATAYPQFLVIDDYGNKPFAISAMGYVALTFRYPAPVTLLALPALTYLIY